VLSAILKKLCPNMNFFYSIIFILIFAIGLNAQSFSTNFNVNLNNNDTKSIVELWQSYLKTNSKDFWVERGTKNLANFNVLDMEGILNPSLMNWGFDNRILSINRISENKYLIKSLFEKENKDVFAITNVVAIKEGNQFKLSNYLFEVTENWKSTHSKNIKYVYMPDYVLKQNEIDEAETFYSDLCKIFNVQPEKITYFIAKNCDNIFDILGYEFIFSKGMSKECGYFEEKNNFIFATEEAGANHFHEITHFINKHFPNANVLLLTGISAYISKDKAHLGKPLIYHTKRVNEYLEKHHKINISKPFDFFELDENTNPQYVIGAVLCDLILEKGGKAELISAFNSTKTDEDLLRYLNSKILKKNEDLNTVLRKRIEKIAKKDNFPNKIVNES
jgi:RNAse (barnase) inhibitor barstar